MLLNCTVVTFKQFYGNYTECQCFIYEIFPKVFKNVYCYILLLYSLLCYVLFASLFYLNLLTYLVFFLKYLICFYFERLNFDIEIQNMPELWTIANFANCTVAIFTKYFSIPIALNVDSPTQNFLTFQCCHFKWKIPQSMKTYSVYETQMCKFQCCHVYEFLHI